MNRNVCITAKSAFDLISVSDALRTKISSISKIMSLWYVELCNKMQALIDSLSTRLDSRTQRIIKMQKGTTLCLWPCFIFSIYVLHSFFSYQFNLTSESFASRIFISSSETSTDIMNYQLSHPNSYTLIISLGMAEENSADLW